MTVTRSGLLAITASAALLGAGWLAGRAVAGFRAERGVSVRRVQAPRSEPPPVPAPVFRRRPPRPVSC